MKQIIITALIALGSGAAVSAQEINDVNTPLHLMKPQYETPYGIPQQQDVKTTLSRVFDFLEGAMPCETVGNKLKQGTLRLTSYEIGVLYAAALDAGKYSGDARYTRFTTDRLGLVAKMYPKVKSLVGKDGDYDPQMRKVCTPGALDDAGAMCSAYVRMAIAKGGKITKEEQQVIENYIDFVHNKQYRLADGIFGRIRPHYNTVWLDDMYMGVPCLAWYGRLTGKTEYISEAVKQIRLFKDRMWVTDKQLFRHGWVEEMNPHPAFHWGRANGWAVLTLCEVLDAMATSQYADVETDRQFVLDLLKQHIEGLCRLQHKTGFWHQLLDKPDTYLETSATAIFTYCIAHAINEGWIDPLAYGAQAFLAWNAVATKVNAKGQVEGTCVGSGMGFDPAFYAYRPVHVMAAHGYGPVVWAGAEMLRMISTTHPKMNDSAVQFYPTEQNTDEPIFSEKRQGVEDEKVLW